MSGKEDWYEITFHIGPCSEKEAIDISLAVGDVAAKMMDRTVWIDGLRVEQAQETEVDSG